LPRNHGYLTQPEAKLAKLQKLTRHLAYLYQIYQTIVKKKIHKFKYFINFTGKMMLQVNPSTVFGWIISDQAMI
jgi:hypothetical protein